MLTDESDALLAALVEIERHVGATGCWTKPARLLLLVRTDELMRAEPSLAEHLRVTFPTLSRASSRTTSTGVKTSCRPCPGCSGRRPSQVAPSAWSRRSCRPTKRQGSLQTPTSLPDMSPSTRVVKRFASWWGLRSGEHAGLARLVSQPDELLSGTDLVRRSRAPSPRR